MLTYSKLRDREASERKAYFEVCKRLRKELGAEDAGKVELSAEEVRALLSGRPPDEPWPDTYCTFDAKWVPFLRVPRYSDMFTRDGITVSPHPDGGAVLASTNGQILLLARDPTASASEAGVRLFMPQDAMDACERPKPKAFHDQGDIFEAEMPEWMIPGIVYSASVSLIVGPKSQPPDTNRHEEDGVVLWGGMIETGHVWRHTDARRLDPVKWWGVTKNLVGDSQPPPPDDLTPAGKWMSSAVMGQIAAAMAAVPEVLFWQQISLPKGTVAWVPTNTIDEDRKQPEVTIIACGCHSLHEVTVPSWAFECEPTKPEPAKEVAHAAE